MKNLDDESINNLVKRMSEYEKSQNIEVESAKSQMEIIRHKWQKIIDELKNDSELQLEDSQIFRLRENLRYELTHIEGHYLVNIHNKEIQYQLNKELWSFFVNTDSELDIAVFRGQQNYRNELFRQKIALREEWRNFFQVLLGPYGLNISLIIIALFGGFAGLRILS